VIDEKTVAKSCRLHPSRRNWPSLPSHRRPVALGSADDRVLYADACTVRRKRRDHRSPTGSAFTASSTSRSEARLRARRREPDHDAGHRHRRRQPVFDEENRLSCANKGPQMPSPSCREQPDRLHLRPCGRAQDQGRRNPDDLPERYTDFGGGSGNQFKHIFIGKERILTKKSRIAPDREHWYYHPDHLGSTVMVTNEQSLDALIAGFLPAAAPARDDTMCTCFTTVALAAAATVLRTTTIGPQPGPRLFLERLRKRPGWAVEVQPADR
jgi:hypothetical protein